MKAFLTLVDGQSLAIIKESFFLDAVVSRDPSLIVTVRIGHFFLTRQVRNITLDIYGEKEKIVDCDSAKGMIQQVRSDFFPKGNFECFLSTIR